MIPMGSEAAAAEETEPAGTEILTNVNGEPVYETLDPEESRTEPVSAASDEYPEGEDDGAEMPEISYTDDHAAGQAENESLKESEL